MLQVVIGLAPVGSAWRCAKGALVPVHWSQQNGDDAGLVGLVAFQRSLHLDAIAVVGGQEVSTDEQQDHRSTLQMLVDGL